MSVPSFAPRALIRAEQWWSVKLAPVFTVFYATLLREGGAITPAWPQALLLLAGLSLGAAYVSISNDVADRADDRIAGKPNRMANRSTAVIAFLLIVPAAGGAAIGWAWRGQLLMQLVYAAAWFVFAAYSLPPLRLKARAQFGVMADALGSQCLPSLLAALAASAALGRAPDPLWCALVATWSGAFGVRGILWHQLVDAAADRASGTATFVQRFGAVRARTLVTRYLFPLELVALTALLCLVPGREGIAALAVSLLFLVARMEDFRLQAVLVTPRERYRLLLFEFYQLFWPAALLIGAAARDPRDLGALAVHLLLFHGALTSAWSDLAALLKRRR